MNEAKQYYERLFTKEENLSIEDQNFFLDKIEKTLTPQQRADLDRVISLEELRIALFDAKKN